MALSEAHRRKLDSIVLKMQTAGEDDTNILRVVEDYKKRYERTPEQAKAERIEYALALAMEENAPPAEIEMIRSMHPAHDKNREQMQANARKLAVEALPVEERYTMFGDTMNKPTAETFEALFPYAAQAIRKTGGSDLQTAAGAYADVSSGLGRTVVGTSEKLIGEASDLITGEDTARPLGEAVGDINRENFITNMLTAPGLVESAALGGALATGLKTAAPGAAKLATIPGVSQAAKIPGAAPIRSGIQKAGQLTTQGLQKIPGVSQQGVKIASADAAGMPIRAAQMAQRGAISSVPAAGAGQARRYSETGEIDPIEAGVEIAAGAIADPAITGFLSGGGKLFKNVGKDYLSFASGKSRELLEKVGTKETSEFFGKKWKGIKKATPDKTLEELRNFGEKANILAKDMYSNVNNFYEKFIKDPASRAYEVVDQIDNVDIGPIRNELYAAKRQVVSEVMPTLSHAIDLKQGPFAKGTIPVGYQTGVSDADAVLRKIDDLIKSTGEEGREMFSENLLRPGTIDNRGITQTRMTPSGEQKVVDTQKIRKQLQEQKLIPEGWKGELPDGRVPWGHQFPDRTINSHNKKIDELILQFAPPQGTTEQQAAQRALRSVLEEGGTATENQIEAAFRTTEKADEAAQFWPAQRVEELRKINAQAGDKKKTKILDKMFTRPQTYTNKWDLWPAEMVLDLRNGFDKSIKSFDRQQLSGWSGFLDNLKKKVRHTAKEELEAAAERTNNPEWIDGMKEIELKMDLSDDLNALLDSRTQYQGLEKYQKFLLSLADNDKVARREFATKVKDLLGVDIAKDANLLALAAEYKNNLPVFNQTPTGTRLVAAQMFTDVVQPLLATTVMGPKGAALMTGLADKATPFVQQSIEGAKRVQPGLFTDLYERE